MRKPLTAVTVAALAVAVPVAAHAAPTTFDHKVSHAEWRDVHRGMSMPQVYAQTGDHGTVVKKTTIERRSIVRVVKSYDPLDPRLLEYRIVYWDWRAHRKVVVQR